MQSYIISKGVLNFQQLVEIFAYRAKLINLNTLSDNPQHKNENLLTGTKVHCYLYCYLSCSLYK